MKAGCANSNAYLWLGGQWVFRRRISNGLTATGRAVFLACTPSVLEYCEDGELSTGGSFAKRYRFTFGDGGIVVVHADPQNDGAPFQTLLFREVPAETGYGLQADAWNICGQDRYDSAYRLSADRFWMRHLVAGPKKAYEIETAFSRPDDYTADLAS